MNKYEKVEEVKKTRQFYRVLVLRENTELYLEIVNTFVIFIIFFIKTIISFYLFAYKNI